MKRLALLALIALALWWRFRPYEPEPESITFAGGGW